MRAYVVKEYKCVYKPPGMLMYRADEVYDLLTDYDVYVWTSDENSSYGEWEIHCDTDAFEKCIEELKTLPPDEISEYFPENPDRPGITNKKIVSIFEGWLKCKDEKDNVIRVHWLD